MEDDCYLPFTHRALTPVMEGITAEVGGEDASVLYDGFDRGNGEEEHLLETPFGSEIVVSLRRAER